MWARIEPACLQIIMEHFEVGLFPMSIELHLHHYEMIRDYFFPHPTEESNGDVPVVDCDDPSIDADNARQCLHCCPQGPASWEAAESEAMDSRGSTTRTK